MTYSRSPKKVSIHQEEYLLAPSKVKDTEVIQVACYIFDYIFCSFFEIKQFVEQPADDKSQHSDVEDQSAVESQHSDVEDQSCHLVFTQLLTDTFTLTHNLTEEEPPGYLPLGILVVFFGKMLSRMAHTSAIHREELEYPCLCEMFFVLQELPSLTSSYKYGRCSNKLVKLLLKVIITFVLVWNNFNHWSTGSCSQWAASSPHHFNSLLFTLCQVCDKINPDMLCKAKEMLKSSAFMVSSLYLVASLNSSSFCLASLLCAEHSIAHAIIRNIRSNVNLYCRSTE